MLEEKLNEKDKGETYKIRDLVLSKVKPYLAISGAVGVVGVTGIMGSFVYHELKYNDTPPNEVLEYRIIMSNIGLTYRERIRESYKTTHDKIERLNRDLELLKKAEKLESSNEFKEYSQIEKSHIHPNLDSFTKYSAICAGSGIIGIIASMLYMIGFGTYKAYYSKIIDNEE